MKGNKVLLLISSIFMFLFLFSSFLIIFLTNYKITRLDIILYSMYLLGSIIFMYYSFSKNSINRFLELIISIILFLGNIISGILGFIYFYKSSTYKKRELPKLEILQSHKPITYILVFIICMFLIFGLDFITDSKIINIVANVFMFILLFIIFFKDLKRDFKYFKEYFREYSSLTLKFYGLSLIVMFILSISIRFYTGIENATNQTNLQESFNNFPLLIAFLAVIIAPFIEELLFRGIFRKFINNKYVCIISSGVLFGIAHVIDDFQCVKELLYILVYSSLGIFLSSLYYKTNNIFTNMLFHFMQNFLAVIAMILISFVGI